MEIAKINSEWTLFLDRDGVINKKIDNDYVKQISEFEFLPNALKAIVSFSKIFGRIIVVTNQQGIGKGLMRAKDLELVHHHLSDAVSNAGGKIDAVYYAPQLAKENSILRKPNIGMGSKAKEDFPEIDFNKSIMVGDSLSDIEFGKKLKMKTVFISEKELEGSVCLPSLWQLKELIENNSTAL
ncbi:MAG: HAD-IIIA family hydrolase [Flavobacteriales bacterium]